MSRRNRPKGRGDGWSNYREVVTPDEAQRYWSISPAQAAANVIPMEAKTR